MRSARFRPRGTLLGLGVVILVAVLIEPLSGATARPASAPAAPPRRTYSFQLPLYPLAKQSLWPWLRNRANRDLRARPLCWTLLLDRAGLEPLVARRTCIESRLLVGGPRW